MDPPQMQPPNSPVQAAAPDVVGGQAATGRPVPQHHHFLDHEKDTVADDQGSQSSTQRRTVRKVPVSRVALQEPNSSDDFVIGKPKNMRIKKSGVKLPKQAPPRMTRKDTQQPIHPDKQKKQYSTIRCAPASIFNILSVMSQPMKDELIRLGFKDFLGFSLDKIDDRLLAIFLMDHIEVDPLRIVINGRELPITPLIVKHVLGLPNGTKTLPVVSASDKAIYQQELREECEQKGMKKLVSERHKKISKIKRFQDLKPNEVPSRLPRLTRGGVRGKRIL